MKNRYALGAARPQTPRSRLRHATEPVFFIVSMGWRIVLAIVALVAAPAAAQMLTIDRPQYRSVYDLQLLTPRQVEWTIHKSDLGNVDREPSWKFKADIPSRLAVARHQDYNKSGFHRGHLCPAQDRSSCREDMMSTFSMANICPQVPSLNVGRWKAVEMFCRVMARQNDSVSVVVVPIFLKRDTTFIGEHRVPVPHAFFKALYMPANDSVIACWFMFNK